LKAAIFAGHAGLVGGVRGGGRHEV
jgi:hypothetical protein